MNVELSELRRQFAIIYLHNNIVFLKTVEESIDYIRQNLKAASRRKIYTNTHRMLALQRQNWLDWALLRTVPFSCRITLN